jgi:hypothetical protein
MMSHLNQGLRKRYNPSTLELCRGALDFVALLAKHEDLLAQMLKRGLSVWRAAYWENEYPQALFEGSGSRGAPLAEE